MLYKPAAKEMELAKIAPTSFLSDVFTVENTEHKPLTSGFYRQNKGEKLVYPYDYDEMKIILEVEGEFNISDQDGNSYSVKPGDALYIAKGDTITFDSTGSALAYFVALRKTIDAST